LFVGDQEEKARGEISFFYNMWLEKKGEMKRRRVSKHGCLDRRFGEQGEKLEKKGKNWQEKVVVLCAFEVYCTSFDCLARKEVPAPLRLLIFSVITPASLS
jgi:hypothetical protein